ncbi:4-(cytidine 5'-diphospho)-2-C-methyl-D-erythritol kinase [Lentisphaera profundi]|uniref:4-diphosphocytidyl-2-C-methyl-D-erythritol kinase n=1 Tax=Lentisphaera profundi TaxID=1658616 RepID=A0ABY7W0Y9_9BACT|nr:4-(cytidine 5'-diphospho)-2-C-methyl-D-erythritol kinase [Lentisphaera profundi]WDE97948.1 4-(cytidine 5'-diphospho)-2-C-methyl-D-erythritol kinase [Lentisphaera profundi]
MSSITVSCPGKVNLFLDVVGKRNDGYHLIESIFLPIQDIADTLTVSKTDKASISISCSHPGVPLDSKNLIHKAACAFAKSANIEAQWHFDLEKNIPVAGGMGGGSSNAASTFMALNELYDHPLSTTTMKQLAIQIGADIPFFFEKSPARVQGIGEEIEALHIQQKLYMLFVPFEFPVAASWAYKHRQAGFSLSPQTCSDYLAQLNNHQHPLSYNDLATPLTRKFPLLKQCCETLINLGAYTSNISGSGPTCFALFENEQKLLSAQSQLKRPSIVAIHSA